MGLYRFQSILRWGVETAFFILKSFLQLALVSAYTQPGVEQDLWASFAFFNQLSAVAAELDEEIKQKNKHRIYRYQLNRNVAAGLLKRFIHSIFLDQESERRARTQVLLENCLKQLEPFRIRENRACNRRIIRGQDRHIYEPNYCSSM